MRAVLTATIISILAGTLLLSGCGQKGPLYIPQQDIPQQDMPKRAIPQDSRSKKSGEDAAIDPTGT